MSLRRLFCLLGIALLGVRALAGDFQVVGVLGNTSGLSARPVPYAFYTGIGIDARGRLYLAGANQGIPVCSQDGPCLAVLPVPGDMVVRSLVARAGDALFFVGQNGAGTTSALFRVVTTPADAVRLTVEQLATGPGHWALSPTLTAAGQLVLGQSQIAQLTYRAVTIDPTAGTLTTLFETPLPPGAQRPWKHTIQVEQDGAISIVHQGGKNWSGRFSPTGERLGDALGGLIVDTYRYHLNYEGGVRRTDLAGRAAPGDCGSGLSELRLAAQMATFGDRYFFVGRGGVAEATWNGTNFIYSRRVGAIALEELLDAGDTLKGIAYTAGGMDVQHPITFPKAQPIGQLLQVDRPMHSRQVMTGVPTPQGMVYLYRTLQGVSVWYDGPMHLTYDLRLPEVKEIGQAAVQGTAMLFADPRGGAIWSRPWQNKQPSLSVWRADLPGVIGLAATPDAVYAATATQVMCFSPDGKTVRWTAPEKYTGIRRLAATAEYVYVCDTANHVVDQLDAATGQRLARLGVPGEAGSAANRLNRPYAIAADLNGVYIADNGNGRVVIATTSLWTPEIPTLPREDTSPIVAAKLPVNAPRAGRMSVNVYDMNDVTVRQLACAQPSDQPVLWDGRDMYGKWAQPGTYKYHGIIAPKLGLKYITCIGQSGTPPYRTPDGKGSWGGVWGNVMDICPVTDAPDSDIVVLWAFEEGEGGLIRMSQDGQVRWKQHLDWWMKATQTALASDGRSVYIVGASAMGAPEGQSNYGGDYRRPLLWRVDAATGEKQLYAPSMEPQPMFGDYRKDDRIITDLAVANGKLYLAADGTLYVIEAISGKQLAAWPVKGLAGVAVDARGQVYVGSGQNIVRLNIQGEVAAVLGAVQGEIWDLDLQPGGGFAVSVGAPLHQVIYLDAHGKALRALGTAQGRPLCGKMQRENFLNPVGLCITGNGKLFVAENSTPRRFTRWSPEGTLEKEFHGPYYFSGMFGVDDEHPEYIYADTHTDLIRYKVDYATGQWDVDAYWIGAYTQADVPMKWWPRIRHKDGKTYWCSGSGAIAELLDDHVRGVAAVYGGSVEPLPDGGYAPSKTRTGLMGTWADTNGDGKKQPEEWLVTKTPAYPITGGGPQQGWGAYFDEQFDLYMHDWSDKDAGGVWKIPAVWKNGVPTYTWEQAQHVGLNRKTGIGCGAEGARTAFAAGGAVYAFNGAYNRDGLPGVGHGRDYMFAQITKYDPATGTPLWHAGQRTAGFASPGEHYCPTGPAGLLGPYLFWTDENSLVHVWDTEHGLYVDTLLEDISRGPAPSPYTVWVELFNTRVFRHPVSGKVYLLAGSDAIYVYELTGADQQPVRFSGTFQLTANGLKAAQARWAAQTVEPARTLHIPRATVPVQVDGNLAEFGLAPTATLALHPTAQGTARLLYDDANLYVAFDVRDDSPWKNAGGDQSALFKTGDTVDVWIGPTNGKRQPTVGDVRILFAPNGAAPIAMAYRPKVQADARRVPLRSPSGEVWMDRIEPLTTVRVAVKATKDGYRLEAAIPRAEIGLDPDAKRFGLDLSINFSDPAGERNVANLRWGRNGAALVYDLPTEARFEPESWGVGELVR